MLKLKVKSLNFAEVLKEIGKIEKKKIHKKFNGDLSKSLPGLGSRRRGLLQASDQCSYSLLTKPTQTHSTKVLRKAEGL